MASILSIFAAGSRFASRAKDKMEAGRVAQAVFDLVDRGFGPVGSERGRREDGTLMDGEVIRSQELGGATERDGTQFRSLWAPAYVTGRYVRTPEGPFPQAFDKGPGLVWRCEIEDYTQGPPGLYLVKITVERDLNGNGVFDLGGDENEDGTDDDLQWRDILEVWRYEYSAILADR